MNGFGLSSDLTGSQNRKTDLVTGKITIDKLQKAATLEVTWKGRSLQLKVNYDSDKFDESLAKQDLNKTLDKMLTLGEIEGLGKPGSNPHSILLTSNNMLTIQEDKGLDKKQAHVIGNVEAHLQQELSRLKMVESNLQGEAYQEIKERRALLQKAEQVFHAQPFETNVAVENRARPLEFQLEAKSPVPFPHTTIIQEKFFNAMHKVMDTETVIARLAGKPPGTFLIYEHPTAPDEKIISYVNEKSGLSHMILARTSNLSFPYEMIVPFHKSFSSLDSFLGSDFNQKNLKTPIPPHEKGNSLTSKELITLANHANITEIRARNLLIKQPPGTYLIRDSKENPGTKIFCYEHNKGYREITCTPGPNQSYSLSTAHGNQRSTAFGRDFKSDRVQRKTKNAFAGKFRG